ncbi:MAG TPA: YfhO family protein, partial [Acidobacteriota bacterium]|nr:YfhO family protein [Acidobacteriota bacterium]
RLYRPPTRHSRLRAPSDDIVWGQRWDLEVLNFYLASCYRIPVIFHNDIYGMAATEQMKLKTTIEALPWNEKTKLLSAAGVSLILTSENLKIPELQKIVVLENKSDTLFYLYRNRMYSGRTHFISDRDACKQTQINTQGSLESTDFKIQSDCAGTLAFSDVYYPGWKVKVNGKPAKLEFNQSGFTTLRMPAGSHTVHYYYFPNSVIAGFIISISSLSLLIIYLLVGKKLQSHFFHRERIPAAP